MGRYLCCAVLVPPSLDSSLAVLFRKSAGLFSAFLRSVVGSPSASSVFSRAGWLSAREALSWHGGFLLDSLAMVVYLSVLDDVIQNVILFLATIVMFSYVVRRSQIRICFPYIPGRGKTT